MGKITSSCALVVKKYLEKAHPATPFAKVLAELTPAERKHFKDLKPDEWVGYDPYIRLIEASARLAGVDPLAFAEDCGLYHAKNDLPLLIRMAIRFGGSGLAMMEADKAWRKYHQPGHLKIMDITPKGAKARIEGLEGGTPVICAVILGYFKGGLLLGGAKKLMVVHTRCRFAGDHYCEYVARWG